MTLTKALIIFALLVIAFNLFFYARFKRLMAEVKRRNEIQQAQQQESEQEDQDV
ncbi:MAG: hypothetical protein HC843_13985 [Sphingomonadales bacterium]|nr:hypothetical protein [Sphingomonadales bacterium]